LPVGRFGHTRKLPEPASRAETRRHSQLAGRRPSRWRRCGALALGVLSAFVLVSAEPARVATLAEELADTDGVAEVYSVAGEGTDLVAVVRVRHHEELAEVVTGRIGPKPGIRSTRTLIAFRAFSRRDLEAIWDLGPLD